jgi:hypothetical protein
LNPRQRLLKHPKYLLQPLNGTVAFVNDGGATPMVEELALGGSNVS